MRSQAVVLLLALAVISMAAVKVDADYQADIILGGPDGAVPGRIFVTAERYRLEPASPTHPVHLLLDSKSGRTTILDREQKTYIQIDTRSHPSLDLNPIEAFRLAAGFYTRQSAGRETINGVACEKINFFNRGRLLMSAWISDKYRLPIKLVNHVFPQMYFEMKHIQEGPVEPGRMLPPADFTPQGGSAASAPKRVPDDSVKEWTIRSGTPQKLSFAKNQKIKLKLSDDAADGLQTKGRIVFYRQAQPPLDRYSAPFRLPNGRSEMMQYPASAGISAIEFQVTQGSIRVQRLDSK